MTDCDHEDILQALMDTTLRAQKAEATIARHEDTIAGLRAFPAIAERDAARRQNADLQAENNRLLERARKAEASFELLEHAANEAVLEAQSERDAATSRADALADALKRLVIVAEQNGDDGNEPYLFGQAISQARAALTNGAKTDGK